MMKAAMDSTISFAHLHLGIGSPSDQRPDALFPLKQISPTPKGNLIPAQPDRMNCDYSFTTDLSDALMYLKFMALL
jgi:hypothetical protein